MKNFILFFLSLILVGTSYLFYKKDEISNYLSKQVSSVKETYNQLLVINDKIAEEVGVPVNIKLNAKSSNGVTKKLLTINVDKSSKKTIEEIHKIAKKNISESSFFKDYDIKIIIE